MSTNKEFNHGIDLKNLSKVVNLADGVSPKEAVNKSQLDATAGLKQDNLVEGQGIVVDGAEVSVNLQTAGVDYDTLTLSGTFYSALNGDYSRMTYRGAIDDAGTNLDFRIDGDWNVYSKDNGSGVWAVIMKRDSDESQSTSPESGTWLAVLTTINPETITDDVTSFIPNYQAVPHDFVTYSSEQDETGLGYSPSSADSQVSYAVGSSPAGLKFTNSKLGIDFADTIESGASTKIYPSSVVKSYIDEQIVEAKDLSNHPFNNAVAQITGNPSNAQSMGEALASEIDNLDTLVSSLQVVDASHTAHILSHSSVLGVSNGEDELPALTGFALSFGGSVNDVASRTQALGESIGNVYSNIGNLLGLGQFDTDFGTGFTILSNNADAKQLFQDTEAELQQISLGLGQFWSPAEAYSNVNVAILNPSIDTFGGAVVVQGDRVLLSGQTDATENGVYIFDTTTTPMVRTTDADADAEFTPNKTIQILRSTDEGISGSTFAYGGFDSPVVGTDNLTFNLKSRGVVGDNTITETKLAVVVADKLNAKADIYSEEITLVANVPYEVNHNLGRKYVNISTYGNIDSLESYHIVAIDTTKFTITSSSAETINVVAIG